MVTCVGLEQVSGEVNLYREAAVVSVKLHVHSLFESLLETVKRQTRRHAAVWQDSARWVQKNDYWTRFDCNDTRCHLLEVFSIAKQWCESGVRTVVYQ